MTTQAQAQALGLFAQLCDFTLEYPDDHVVALIHERERIAIFSQMGVTEESLQEECILHLIKKHGWDGSLWKKKEANDGG